ncbi:MAG: hypothetical protein H6707_19480 [Deltaproteobacteria bacterium]|nr:hypothetical protein [Deltaproteobacteria bacterium]
MLILTISACPTAALASPTTIASSTPAYRNRISARPLSMLFGLGSFTYERALGDRFSLEISPSFIYWGWTATKIYGGGAMLGASAYLTGAAPRGLRIHADVMPLYIRGEDNDSTAAVFALGIRALCGYNWVWRSRFSLGLSGGLQYLHFKIDGITSVLNGVFPAMDLSLGYAW